MYVAYLKSGGTVTCAKYTLKEGVARMVEAVFAGAELPGGRDRYFEVDVPLDNLLYIVKTG